MPGSSTNNFKASFHYSLPQVPTGAIARFIPSRETVAKGKREFDSRARSAETLFCGDATLPLKQCGKQGLLIGERFAPAMWSGKEHKDVPLDSPANLSVQADPVLVHGSTKSGWILGRQLERNRMFSRAKFGREAKGNNAMSRPSWLQKIYWTRFAKPVEDRALFQELIRRPIASVLEIGVGDGQRMRRIARLAEKKSGVDVLRYIGTDEFESAQDSRRHLSLKQAHQLAGQLGFKASLIPGDVHSALPRVAHKLGASDLIVADGCLDPSNPLSGFVGSWLNRIAHNDSIILASTEAGGTLNLVDPQVLDLPSRQAA